MKGSLEDQWIWVKRVCNLDTNLLRFIIVYMEYDIRWNITLYLQQLKEEGPEEVSLYGTFLVPKALNSVRP